MILDKVQKNDSINEVMSTRNNLTKVHYIKLIKELMFKHKQTNIARCMQFRIAKKEIANYKCKRNV